MHILFICFLAAITQNSLGFIGEETDLNSLLQYETVDEINEDSEIWQDNDTNGLTYEWRKKLCENVEGTYYLEKDEYTVDCSVFNQEVSKETHIKKRDADDAADEGSGDGTVFYSTTTDDPDSPTDQKEHSSIDQKSDKNPTVPPTTTTENMAETTTTSKTSSPTTPETSTKEIMESSQVTIQSQDDTPRKSNLESINDKEEGNKLPKDEKPEVEKEIPTKLSQDKNESYNPKHDAEHTGRSFLTDKNTETHMENTDKSKEQIDTGSSTMKAGAKDTTILIVLFAAVVTVGCLALAYNYIKKRRQRSADLERIERAPPVKRSLQNLAKLEEEPEKAPLMDDHKEIEIVTKENSERKTNVESDQVDSKNSKSENGYL